MKTRLHMPERMSKSLVTYLSQQCLIGIMLKKKLTNYFGPSIYQSKQTVLFIALLFMELSNLCCKHRLCNEFMFILSLYFDTASAERWFSPQQALVSLQHGKFECESLFWGIKAVRRRALCLWNETAVIYQKVHTCL